MKVIFHPTYGMNIDIQLSTNARNVSPQFGPKFPLDGFVPSFRTEHHMHDVLRIGMGHVPHLRCSAFLYTMHPALTRWAKVCRAYGALQTQRRRTGWKPALRKDHGIPAAALNLRCRPLQWKVAT